MHAESTARRRTVAYAPLAADSDDHDQDTKPAQQQPPRQHNAELAERYQRTMDDARAYRNPPLLRRLLLLLFVLGLLYTASRLQFRARSQVMRYQIERAIARGELDPDVLAEDGGAEYEAYAAADGATFLELFGMGSEGLI